MTEVAQNNLIGWIQLVISIILMAGGLFTVYLNLNNKILTLSIERESDRKEIDLLRADKDSHMVKETENALAMQECTIAIRNLTSEITDLKNDIKELERTIKK